jgi:lysophospholipase L1-like esterase
MRRPIGTAAAAVLVWSAGRTYVRWRRLPSFQGADASGTFGDPSLPPLSIAVVGDSSCTGPGLEGIEDVWVRRVSRALGDRFHVTMDSYAVGGSTARDVLEAQVPRLIEHQYDVAIVSVGANDMLRGIPTRRFHTDLAAIVDALTPVSGAIVLSGVGDMGSIPRLPWLLRWPAHNRGRAADRAHADVASHRAHVFKVPIWDRAADFRADLTLWSPDLFHASSSGHALFAEVAMPTISDALAYAPN